MKGLNALNTPQQAAVTSEDKRLLVLAGAGSGKTRVLVHRIAWLLQHLQISPYAVFAVTFTNKAANEMRERIEALQGAPLSGMWMGTFHRLAHRLLRLHWQDALLPETFQIIDADDQLRLVRRAIKTLNVDEEKWPPRKVQWYINHQKEEGIRPKQSTTSVNFADEVLIRLYAAYEDICQKNGLVDFSELLLRAVELLQTQDSLLAHYRQRFTHVLVDEFQDTNRIQYRWLQLLAGDQNHVMIVGDDDQSIYGWRGAKVENIFQFQKDFPEAKVIRLEQNYRSTGYILQAANALITHNASRLGKNLWTQAGQGEPIILYAAYNDQDESRYVASQISSMVKAGVNYNDCAVLYRSNAQSRSIEEALLMLNIPYRIYGGMRFFERAEIKDALAYLQLMIRYDNDAAFERILNMPPRGIGDRTLEVLRNLARTEHLSLWKAAQQLLTQGSSGRTMHSLRVFIEMIERLTLETQEMNLLKTIEHMLHATQLWDYYRQDRSEKGQMRIENLEELMNAARQYEMEFTRETQGSLLEEFLAHAALETGERQTGDDAHCVQLMTLHSAKGLEFPLVFLTGLEERLFPHQMSMTTPHELEEERRLCYVGITRAKQKLYLTYAEIRRLHGKETIQRPSRFLREIPETCMQSVRMMPKISRPVVHREKESTTAFKLGQTVVHAVFGEGTIIHIDGYGASTRLQIRFKKVGVKWLIAELAKFVS